MDKPIPETAAVAAITVPVPATAAAAVVTGDGNDVDATKPVDHLLGLDKDLVLFCLSQSILKRRALKFTSFADIDAQNLSDEDDGDPYPIFPLICDYKLKMPLLSMNNMFRKTGLHFLCRRKTIKQTYCLHEGVDKIKGKLIPFCRKKYVPPRDVIEFHLCNGITVWSVDIDYDLHNVTKRSTSKKDNWNNLMFLNMIQDVIQKSENYENVRFHINPETNISFSGSRDGKDFKNNKKIEKKSKYVRSDVVVTSTNSNNLNNNLYDNLSSHSIDSNSSTGSNGSTDARTSKAATFKQKPKKIEIDELFEEDLIFEIKEIKNNFNFFYIRNCVLIRNREMNVTDFNLLGEDLKRNQLFALCCAGKLEEARRMFSEYSSYLDVNIILSENGWTILQHASYHGYFEMVKWLVIETNAIISLCSSDGWSALHCACKSGNFI